MPMWNERRRTRGIRNTEVENLAALDEVVQTLHQLGNGRGVVPPVNVE